MLPHPLPTDVIRRAAWGQGYARGVEYFRSGAVHGLHWDAQTAQLTARVAGSGSQPYRTTIGLDPADPARPVVWTNCSCPLQAGCKHIVATLLAVNERAEADRRDAAAPVDSATRAAPSWRDLVAPQPTYATGAPLALGVELRQRHPRDRASWAPRRVATATARSIATDGGDLLVGLRPLVRSDATGNWIKGDVSWDALRRPGPRFHPGHVRWMLELFSIAHDTRTLGVFPDASEWLTLDTVGSALLWPHLAAAAEAGVVLVATAKGQSVRLAETAGATVGVSRTPGAGLALTARIAVDSVPVDTGSVRPVGRTGLYHWRITGQQIALALAPAPLSDALCTLLAQPDGIAVPASEAEEFLRIGAVRLARRTPLVADTGVDLPEPAPPVVELSVRFRPREVVEYAFEWVYADGTRHGCTVDHDDADRDGSAEAEILARLHDAWAGAADTPFLAAAALEGLEAAEFVARTVPALEELPAVRVVRTGRPRAYTELTGTPEISVSTVESTDPDWFDLGIIVTIDGRRIPFQPLFAALSQRRTKLLLADGGFFSLAHPALQRLRELIDEAAGLVEWETGPRISRYQTTLWEDFEDIADVAEPALTWRAAVEGLRGVDHIDPAPVPAGLRAQLRPYQRAGYDWLAFLWRHRMGGILADDMGLGKTLQALALVAHLRETGERRPVLVVAPTSVIGTWRSEAERFAPDLRARVVDTTSARRAPGALVDEADLVITSYTVLRLDEDEFAEVEWAAVILDEAQFVKNPATRIHRAVARLRAQVVIAITGTPMENTLVDLWALLALTAPGLFPSARRFRQEYVGPIEQGKVPENQEGGAYRAARVERLRRRIRPVLLRRTKDAVAADLPGKQEQILTIDLHPAHRTLYDTVLQRERQKVLGLLEDLDRNRFIVFRSLTLLRMLSLSPALVDPEHARIPSAKLDALIEQVAELAAEGHRCLVFSQFTSFLAQAADRLTQAGLAHEYLDGATRRRSEVIDAFRSGAAPVFLISLKAGGFGLTLTEADYVFLLDPWWNPAAESQAIDRVHRIGQTRSVFVYRLIAAGTIEEKVLALQQRKARLIRSVLSDDDLFARSLTAADIRGLFEE